IRNRVVADISSQYGCDVELRDLHLSPLTFSATGGGLVMRERGFQDVPPLVTIDRFAARVSPAWLLLGKVHVLSVSLEGLKANVPPRQDGLYKVNEAGGKNQLNNPRYVALGNPMGVVVEEIVADGAQVKILPKDQRKEPLFFAIHRLRLYSPAPDGSMQFKVALTNPEPPGKVESSGRFGPWDRDDPSMSQVSGSYTFKDADLSYFQGISGKLASTGKYHGLLGHIEVDGNTDTPDFAVAISNQPVHLKTQFHAIVDGTNGDTYLQPVNAQFGHSSLIARGGIYGVPGGTGKTVSLDVTVNDGRIADMLRLAVKGPPILTGAVAFKTKLEVPPGPQDITTKLYLNGSFNVADAKFAQSGIQNEVNELSDRAQGDPKAARREGPAAASDLGGNFVLSNGTMKFSDLEFKVEGAVVKLSGTYGLVDDQIDFTGTVSTDAKVSQMTTGIKSVFLKVADPLFKKHGAGAVIPLHITGTGDSPKYKVELGKLLKQKF
ncbi:MAG TPA: AsmA-like C-terminal region-containing protein, partial [Blastocatellia bacterium]